MYNFYPKKLVQPPGCAPNILLIMKLTTFILVAAILQVSAATYAQKITLTEKNTPLNKVFEKISDQTGYDFIISSENLKLAKPVSVTLQNEDLKSALDKVFASQPLAFVIQNKMVVVSKKERPTANMSNNVLIIVHGRVSDSTGLSLPGATVKMKGGKTAVTTDENGNFKIEVPVEEFIEISFVGYDPFIVKIQKEQPFLNVVLHTSSSKLNEIQVIGYGSTTKRLNTGSVSTISAANIENQPVTNILSAISGQAPGVFVQASNGLAGGAVNIQVRGQNSLRNTSSNNGNNPLYIIDGVPFAITAVNSPASAASADILTGFTITGPLSPFNSLNPADIESINILKDADATAIYGSRGANGVILITTKKGRSGPTKTTLSYSQGISTAASLPKLLSLDQYLKLRREAFANDGITPSSDPNSPNYAPDLSIWSQQNATNWAKYLIGKNAPTSDVQAGLSGGTDLLQFAITANYHQEGTILLGAGNYRRAGLHFNINTLSANRKFNVQFSGSYTGDDNDLPNPNGNIATELLLSPNFPLYDNSGQLNWTSNVNPIADSRAKSKTQTSNFIANTILSYKLLKGLLLKTSIGYNRLNFNQAETFPFASQNPAFGVSKARFGNGYSQSFIAEPQVTYDKKINNTSLSFLAGGSYQNSLRENEGISASNFSNDGLIANVSSASTLTASNSSVNYKYMSAFARATVNIDGKYIANVSARRDGSSRFGEGHQFGNFGAVGAAWLFSEEDVIKHNFDFLSFGKLRASYGITGNDQITDYQYLSTYGSTTFTYQGVSGLKSAQIANPDLHWESNKKAEIALELGFFKDRIIFNTAYFQNRSSDQLIAYTLPTLTGFANYQANLPAIVQNTGWEFELNTINISGSHFTWKSSINFTLPKNKLVSFPGLTNSSYANALIIGQDISQATGYLYTGVDPQTGKGQYYTLPGATTPYLLNKWGQTSPYWYGGIGNTFSYDHWQLSIYGQFSKQYQKGGISASPGSLRANDFANVSQRWEAAGDNATIPKSSTNFDFYYTASTANWFNATYFRVKTIALAYSVPSRFIEKIGLKQMRVYSQGQNLLTFWNKNLALYDPETGIGIPPLKTFTIGLQLTF